MASFPEGRDARRRGLYRLAADELTRRGVIRFFDDVIDLGSSNPFTYSFTTEGDIVVLRKIRIESFMSPNRAMGHATFELFEGGAISGGVSVFSSILNIIDVGLDPVTGILKGVTIDTPGDLKYRRNMIGNDALLFDDEFGPFVLNADTLYQITLTDQEVNKNARLKISVEAVRIA